jgi:hypothetical protein
MSVPKRWRICSGSAPTPWNRNSSTKAASPDWPGVGFSGVTDTLFSKGRLGGSQAAGLHQQLITRFLTSLGSFCQTTLIGCVLLLHN